MGNRSLSLFGLVIVLLAAGCGGGGNNGPSVPSPFAGSWSGPFIDTMANQRGTLTVAVGTDGRLTGSIANQTTGQTGTVSGRVNNAGALTATYSYPAVTAASNGTVALDPDGDLSGVYDARVSGQLVGSGTFDLTKQQ